MTDVRKLVYDDVARVDVTKKVRESNNVFSV